MRLSTVFAAAMLFLLGIGSPAQAGLLELKFDNITRHRDCSSEPCRGNGLHYKRIYVRDRYLRFDIHTQPARYELRRERVMIAPPTIVVMGGRHHDRRVGRYHLVELPVGHYRTVAPARYVWVTRQVLVHPARNYVTRRQPHYAYYPDTAIVYH